MEGAGSWLGEGVIREEHDALEVKRAAVGGDGVLDIVIAEFGGKEAGVAAAWIVGRVAAAVGVGVGMGEVERVVN